MRPRAKSALLWGAVGALAFLALVQGVALVASPFVSIGRAVAVAALVGLASAGAAYVLEHRIAAWAATRAENGREDDE